jgi:hypothetical protein
MSNFPFTFLLPVSLHTNTHAHTTHTPHTYIHTPTLVRKHAHFGWSSTIVQNNPKATVLRAPSDFDWMVFNLLFLTSHTFNFFPTAKTHPHILQLHAQHVHKHRRKTVIPMQIHITYIYKHMQCSTLLPNVSNVKNVRKLNVRTRKWQLAIPFTGKRLLKGG